MWQVEFTEEFEKWWNSLREEEQVDVNAKVMLLEQFGPILPRPHSDVIGCSKHSNMKELRIQHSGCPYRVLYTLIPGAAPFYSLAATKPEMTGV